MRIRSTVVAAVPSLQKAWLIYKRGRLRSMCARFEAQFGLVVRSGPFKGMRYLPESKGSSLLPKLLGSYESVLHAALEELLGERYDNIINIGCAEGYYAVGLARLCGGTPVIAFDSDPQAQMLCAETARLNGVLEQVQIRGTCDPDSLSTIIRHRTLIMCDCEGDERRLLDPALVPNLKNCDLVVELHPFLDPAIPDLIAGRFQNTHAATELSKQRNEVSLEELKAFRWFDRRLAVSEGRSGVAPQWILLQSKCRN
jgi:hypothetical protein